MRIQRMMQTWAALLAGLMCVPTSAHDYQVETLIDGLNHPWSLDFLPDGRALLTERSARLRVIEDGQLRAEPIKGLPDIFVSGQAGLFEVMVDPQFRRNQTVFLSYAHGQADSNHLQVARARLLDGALEDFVVLFTSHPGKSGDAHYGGRMVMLDDGSLVIGFGDGFIYREQAQRLDSHLGSLIRIDRDGGVPLDNPFVGRADVLPEIYSYGHRNVQGVVFDETTGFLFAHEHGPRGGDELNVIRPGRNYGWPLATHGVDYTGARVTPFTAYPRTIEALLHWTPSIAPSGMSQYRGERFPNWHGDLFVSALAEKSVRRIELEEGLPVRQEILFKELDARIRDVVAGPDGALYLLTDEAAPNGRVLRIVPSATPSVASGSLDRTEEGGQ